MPKIMVLPHAVICPNSIMIEAKTGDNLCQLLLQHNVEIEHACDLAKACTTCHIIVRAGFESLAPADDIEEDLLDRAWGLTACSRLSCQAIIGTTDLVVEIPKYSINHAKEG
jgi:2Fe-2S ferredoxin